ncbi:Phosphatidylinositol-4-phosphate 5-kinase, N-terminal domain [Phytophthora cactorum]|nr:Phosphatidylinositol-4-phosphate 5-kinase, N-terminal domain [Phytophthora cactorum]
MLEQTVEESAETVHRSFGKCCNERHFVRTARRRPLPCLVGKKHLKGAAEKQKESFATRPTRGFGSLMTKYHIFGGLWSLICAVISHFDTRYALFSFCWLSSSGDILSRTHDDPDREQASNGTLTAGIFFALYIVVVYCTSLIAIVRTWNTFVKGLPDTFRTRKRIQRHLKYYVGCYFGYWTLVLACYAVFSLLPHSTSDSKGGIKCRVWHLLSCLLLAKGMVHALIWTRTSNILRIIEQLRRNGTVNLPPQDGNWDDNINWALRLEILTNTTKGICQSVDRAEHQARASAESSLRSISVSDSSLEEGIVDSSAGQDDYCDRKESYTQIEELILENRNDSRSNGPRTEGVVFKDFAPHVFRRLREEAKVSSASYRNSLQQTTKERRNPDTFMTRFFGCHGLTMYGKTVFFVVMQSVFATSLQIHERFDLKGSWVGRLEGRKPTGTVATCKFCNAEYTIGGSHDQRCNVRGEGNMNHQYDQVGKDLNWNRHMALPYSTARAVAVQLTADSEFLCSINCIDYSLLVGIHHRSFNVSHYSSADSFDSPKLVRHDSGCSMSSQFRVSTRSGRSNSSDSYSTNSSFIRNRSSSGGNQYSRGCYCSSNSNSIKKSFHPIAHGGMSVDEVHGPGLYYLGLIDILQQWNLRKRVEHFVRVYVLMQDRHGISVVNPRQYADRFQQRVIKELIYDAAAMPTRDHRDSVSFTQLQIQNQRNAQLVESNRTLSTMLASLDGSGATFTSQPSTRLESFANFIMSPNVGGNSMTNSPCTPPLAAKARVAVRAVSTRSWDNASCCSSTGVGRLSGGLAMEIPGTIPWCTQQLRNPAAAPPSITSAADPVSKNFVGVLEIEQPASVSVVYTSSSEVVSSSGSRQCSDKSSHSSNSTGSVVHLEEGALRGPSSPLDYRIRRRDVHVVSISQHVADHVREAELALAVLNDLGRDAQLHPALCRHQPVTNSYSCHVLTTILMPRPSSFLRRWRRLLSAEPALTSVVACLTPREAVCVLVFALDAQYESLVRFLYAHESLLSLGDASRRFTSVLHCAAAHGCAEVVQRLLRFRLTHHTLLDAEKPARYVAWNPEDASTRAKVLAWSSRNFRTSSQPKSCTRLQDRETWRWCVAGLLLPVRETRAMEYAASAGRLEVVMWLFEQEKKQEKLDTDVVVYMVQPLESKLQYLHKDMRMPLDQRTLEAAIGSGHFELVKYITDRIPVEQRHTLSPAAAEKAAASGNVDVLAFVVERLGLWSPQVLIAAAPTGNIDMAEWIEKRTDSASEEEQQEEEVVLVRERRDRAATSNAIDSMVSDLSAASIKRRSSYDNFSSVGCARPLNVVDGSTLYRCASLGHFDMIEWLLQKKLASPGFALSMKEREVVLRSVVGRGTPDEEPLEIVALSSTDTSGAASASTETPTAAVTATVNGSELGPGGNQGVIALPGSEQLQGCQAPAVVHSATFTAIMRYTKAGDALQWFQTHSSTLMGDSSIVEWGVKYRQFAYLTYVFLKFQPVRTEERFRQHGVEYALHVACAMGHLDVVTWICGNCEIFLNVPAAELHAKLGRLSIWNDALIAAARCGQIGILTWLHEKFTFFRKVPDSSRKTKLIQTMADAAAGYGQIRVLRWLQVTVAPQITAKMESESESTAVVETSFVSTEGLLQAMVNRHVDVVQWVCAVDIDLVSRQTAQRRGELATFLREEADGFVPSRALFMYNQYICSRPQRSPVFAETTACPLKLQGICILGLFAGQETHLTPVFHGVLNGLSTTLK